MLERVDFSITPLPKDEYKLRRGAAIDRLVALQQQARREGVGLVVLFEGWNGAGKGSRISDLMYELDARATSVHVTEDLDRKTLKRFPGRKYGVTGFFPDMQEFWAALGERGCITFYDRGWYTIGTQRLLHSESRKPSDTARRLSRCLAAAEDFEQMLTDNGYAVVKFFLHMTKRGQKKRLEQLAGNPETAWRVSDEKLQTMGNYDEAYGFYDRLLEGSSFRFAPWHVLNGEDKRRTNIAIAEALVDALETRLAQKRRTEAAGGACGEDDAAESAQSAAGAQAQAPAYSRYPVVEMPPTIEGIDLSASLSKEAYDEALEREQKRLNKIENLMYQARIPLIAMFEGWDAAGKGGAIKRIAQSLDARAYTIFPSPAPTKPELMHPHLWRYWTRLPKAGHVGIYDRSWYGRVLVERVEGLAAPEEWGRAYDEINAFERELVDWGAILVKFWVEVSDEEQLRRFREREANPAKRWKITEEDWRNRDKRPAYLQATNDMFRLTSTTFAPWTILESEDKRFARVKALRTINEAIEARLG